MRARPRGPTYVPMTSRRALLLLPLAAALPAACTGVPAGVTPVAFDAERYLGTWYEIVRFDHSFERGLEQVQATYTKREDGRIGVLNQGTESATGRVRQATGTARFLQDSSTASLGVTFQWPFEGGYHVIRLDPDYRIALVVGPNDDYLWLLSRTPTLPDATVQEWLEFAEARGWPASRAIRVRQQAS